jgi:hypothetical protein
MISPRASWPTGRVTARGSRRGCGTAARGTVRAARDSVTDAPRVTGWVTGGSSRTPDGVGRLPALGCVCSRLAIAVLSAGQRVNGLVPLGSCLTVHLCTAPDRFRGGERRTAPGSLRAWRDRRRAAPGGRRRRVGRRRVRATRSAPSRGLLTKPVPAPRPRATDAVDGPDLDAWGAGARTGRGGRCVRRPLAH